MFYVTKTATAALLVAASCLGTSAMADFSPTTEMVPMHSIAPLNLDQLEIEDQVRQEEGLPWRFALPEESFITPGNSGTWDRDEEGLLRWRMRLGSKGAPHINLGFEHWHMPPSGEMMIESADKWTLMGPYTAGDNTIEGQLWLPFVTGDDLFISITCDDVDRFAIEEDIILTKINVGYRGFDTPNTSRGTSESCNHDVVCPLCDDWQNEVPAIGVYTLQGYLTCTGVMMNNTAQDQRPLFITANHCGIGSSNDQTLVVYWNHQNSYCRTPGSSDSGGGGNGNYNQSTSGSQFLASNNTYDCCIVELNSTPPESYGVTYAGWSRASSHTGGRVIHHPQTAEKRCSSLDYISSQGQYWNVNYDEGRTDYGSSGAPIFNGNHHVIGQLYGGSSFCDNDLNDVYGKSIGSWWSGLDEYLDPQGTSPNSLDTLNPGNLSTGACCWDGNCYMVEEVFCDNVDGDFQGLGVTCGDVNCSDPDPTGGCCVGTSCSVSTQANCSGTYLGDGSDCSGDPCAADPTGGCCVGTSCSVSTQSNCSGTYLGDGTDCSGDPCAADPTGACCNGTSCSVSTQANCSGNYLGDGTSCSGNPCDTSGESFVGLAYSIVGSNLVDDAEPTWTVDVYAILGDNCRLDAVAGDTGTSKMVSTTTSFYQNIYGGNTSGTINPALFGAFPDLRYDSFMTIGRFDSSDNNLSDIGIDFSNFENGGAIDSSDGSWFCTPDDSQGDAGDFQNESCESGNGVLVARLTVRDLSASVYFEALFQGKDAAGSTWQTGGSLSIVYDDCNGLFCDGDFTQDGVVDVSDLLGVIAGWGNPYDVADLLLVIADWGCTG